MTQLVSSVLWGCCGAPGAPRRALSTADGFQNLTSMLEPLERNVLWLHRGKTRARKLFSFLSVQRTASICVCQAVRPLSTSVVHIFPSVPLQRQSSHFGDNHTKVFVSRSILAQFRQATPSIESSRPQVFLLQNKTCIWATVTELLRSKVVGDLKRLETPHPVTSPAQYFCMRPRSPWKLPPTANLKISLHEPIAGSLTWTVFFGWVPVDLLEFFCKTKEEGLENWSSLLETKTRKNLMTTCWS